MFSDLFKTLPIYSWYLYLLIVQMIYFKKFHTTHRAANCAKTTKQATNETETNFSFAKQIWSLIRRETDSEQFFSFFFLKKTKDDLIYNLKNNNNKKSNYKRRKSIRLNYLQHCNFVVNPARNELCRPELASLPPPTFSLQRGFAFGN